MALLDKKEMKGIWWGIGEDSEFEENKFSPGKYF